MNNKSKYFSDLNIELYFKDIRDEKENREEKKDKEKPLSKDELVVHNLLLVSTSAQKFLRYNVDYLDLIQEGNLALIKAAETFDLGYGTMFSTYAVKLIEQQMSLYVKRNSKPIKLPDRYNVKMKNLEEVIDYYKNENGCFPNIYELAEETSSTVDNIFKLLILREGFIRLDRSITTDDEGDILRNMIEDKSSISPMQNIINKETSEEVKEILSSLKPEERKLIMERYQSEIGPFKSKTLSEIAKESGVSSQTVRVRQEKVKKKIIRMVKKYPELRESVMKKG